MKIKDTYLLPLVLFIGICFALLVVLQQQKKIITDKEILKLTNSGSLKDSFYDFKDYKVYIKTNSQFFKNSSKLGRQYIVRVDDLKLYSSSNNDFLKGNEKQVVLERLKKILFRYCGFYFYDPLTHLSSGSASGNFSAEYLIDFERGLEKAKVNGKEHFTMFEKLYVNSYAPQKIKGWIDCNDI